MVIVAPEYEGSKSYRVLGAPLIAPAGGGGSGLVQFKGLDDLRFRLLQGGGFEAGPLVGYRFGRDEDVNRRLRGTGDIDGGLVVGGFLGYRMGGIFPFASYHHQVTGDGTGSIIRAGLETNSRFGSVALTTTLGATWASEAYNQSFFGIDAVQAARSGLRLYDAEAGIKDVFLSASADIALDARWTLKLMGRYTHLLGEARDSPLVETNHQLFGGVGLTYRFNLN